MLFSAMVINQSDLCKKHMFYKSAHISGPTGFPDIILNAFQLKFHNEKHGYFPWPVDHTNKFDRFKNYSEKNATENPVPARPPTRASG